MFHAIRALTKKKVSEKKNGGNVGKEIDRNKMKRRIGNLNSIDLKQRSVFKASTKGRVRAKSPKSGRNKMNKAIGLIDKMKRKLSK